MGPLTGIRIIDLSRMLPAGAMTQLLADLGAEVIKVERPGTGEESRGHGAAVAGTTTTHAFLDRGKRSVAIDLKHPLGVAAVRALAREADAVIESFRPGVADRLGVGYEDLRRENDRLVYCSVNGYGTGGPREQEPGHDLNFLAYAGAVGLGGTREHGPQLAGIQAADLIGGLTGGIGLLAALLAVRAGGPGRRIEVALADAALWAVGVHLSAYLADGSGSGPESTLVTGAAPAYRLYRCADGRYLAVAAVEQQFWAEFVDVLGRPDLLDRQFDPDAVTEVQNVIGSRPLAEWMTLLDGRQTCASPVQTLDEVCRDPQFLSRQMFVPVPGAPTVLQVGNPIKTSTRLPDPEPVAPVVGRDTMQVLAEFDVPAEVLQAAAGWVGQTPSQHRDGDGPTKEGITDVG